MSEQNQEREINLKEMMFFILYQWKKMLLAALILAVVLGGFRGYKAWKTATDPKAVTEHEQEYQTALNTYEGEKSRKEQELADIQEDIENQKEYLENSLIMQMDHHNVYEVQTSLYISTDYQILPDMTYQNTDKTQLILASYQAALTNSEVIGEIGERVDLESKYLREVISVTGEMGHILNITVRHAEQAEAEKIMDMITESMERLHTQLTESIGAHEVSTVFTSASFDVDSELAEIQKNEKNLLLEYEDALESRQAELDALVEPAKTDISISGAIKTGMKWAILGAAGGVFLVILAACAIFIVSDRVYSGDELKNRFGLKMLGSVAADKKCGKLDTWLKRKEGRMTENTEANYELMAVNVKNYCGDAKMLLVTGDGDERLIKELVEILQPKLPEVKLECCGSLLRDAKALQLLPECDGVLLVEKCGDSNYTHIAGMTELVKDAKKQLIGCIIQDK